MPTAAGSGSARLRGAPGARTLVNVGNSIVETVQKPPYPVQVEERPLQGRETPYELGALAPAGAILEQNRPHRNTPEIKPFVGICHRIPLIRTPDAMQQRKIVLDRRMRGSQQPLGPTSASPQVISHHGHPPPPSPSHPTLAPSRGRRAATAAEIRREIRKIPVASASASACREGVSPSHPTANQPDQGCSKTGIARPDRVQ